MSVLGHPQDLRCHGRERWDGDVHVVPSGHGEQGGDLGIQAVETCSLQPRAYGRGRTEVSLRTDEMGVLPQSPGEMCHLIPDVGLTFVWSPCFPSGVFSD